MQAADNPLKAGFELFTYNEKLPSNSVIRIYHDKEGYMWFGTKDGLCRFDGYDMKVFRSSALSPGRLTNNEIQCIAEDNDHKLWVGTLEGINIVDKKSYTIKPLDNEFVKKERINSILVDSKGFVWIATSNYGALRMDPKSNEFVRYSSASDSPLKLKGNNVTNIYEDKTGRIWISLWKDGLCSIDADRRTLTQAPKIGQNNNPFRLFQDREGMYWVCTWGDGVFSMNVDTQSNIQVKPITTNNAPGNKIDNIVYSITQDEKNGYIWLVTFSGLNVIEKQGDGTFRLLDTRSLFKDYGNKLFHEIARDRYGNLWIGSVGDGLYKLDFGRLSIQNFALNEIKEQLNVPSYVTRICEAPSGDIFIVINRIGLFRFDPKTGAVKRALNPVLRGLSSISAITSLTAINEIWIANEGDDLVHTFKNTGEGELTHLYSFSLSKFSNSDNTINGFFEDSGKNIWIGTNQGLYLKPKNGAVKLISPDIHFINTISEDSEKRIWIGTEKNGVYVFKTQPDATNYTMTRVNLNIDSYRSYSVQSICCAKNGNVYIGTKDGCLYFFDSKANVAKDISGMYGITDEGIMDILEDNQGMLWISTIKRIIKFNPKLHTSTYFSHADGMFITSFFKDSRTKLKSGLILFGGNNGISMFNPATLNVAPKPSNQHVVISDIQIQNKSIYDNELHTRFDAEKNRVKLAYSENSLSIEFSALNYSSARKIQYAYMLSGIDKDWTYTGNSRRFVNYANLPAGKYIFKVKASDENGMWSNKITSLEVVVSPPLYRTWWAYLFYFVLLGIIAYFLSRNIVNRIRLRNALKISNIEKEKTEELTQIKLRYFTNISHELLTPLTIIMLLIEGMQKKSEGDLVQLDMMKSNVIRLKRLIQQILVFRKTESGNMKLKIKQDDIVSFVNNICQANFQPLVLKKEINFSVSGEFENYMAYFDADKLDKILYNLLSNAFKHTPKNGSIAVRMSFIPRNNNTIMRLSVSDTGDGIAEEDLPHIFKRFYISSTSDQSQSHGIGLALTYDLLQLHKGNIEAKSRRGEGAVFTIEIPVSKEAYTPEELSADDMHIIALPEVHGAALPETASAIEPESSGNKEFRLLVVEDNQELKNLVVENFRSKYHVLSADNGKQALDVVKENDVDLVISDVMMPEMDGLTLCKLLKNDVNTSHISVLMLTAKNSSEDRIDCYNAGADSYIAKPFELALLDARVENLIQKRKQKVNSFQGTHEINISSMEYGSIDELFLKQAVQNIEKKLSDENYNFDMFALDMATSKSTLHRKLKSLTGLSPGEFIRSIRLKHAALMLQNNTGNISEIAFAVGFNDPKYFSRCFKSEFDLTPREYQESKKQGTMQ